MQKVEKIRFSTSSEVVWPVRESRDQRARYRSRRIISCGILEALAKDASANAASAVLMA